MRLRLAQSFPSFQQALVLLFILAVAVLPYVISLRSAAEYIRLSDHPIVVEAEVTEHRVWHHSSTRHRRSYDDYDSYVEYSVEGTHYKTLYEENAGANNVTPVGTKVTVTLNPEDPGMMLKKIISPGQVTLASLFLGCVVGSLGHILLEPVPPPYYTDTEVRRCIREDLYRQFWRGSMCLIPGMAAIFWAAFLIAYPIPSYGLMETGIFLLVLLFATLTAIFIWRVREINKEKFRICTDVLKYITQGGEHSYILGFAGQEGTWTYVCRSGYYGGMCVGDTVTSVWLDGKNIPMMFYFPAPDEDRMNFCRRIL